MTKNTQNVSNNHELLRKIHKIEQKSPIRTKKVNFVRAKVNFVRVKVNFMRAKVNFLRAKVNFFGDFS